MNLYAFGKDRIIELCQDILFDKKDTDIVMYVIIEDLSIKQIADKLNISSQTVSKRIRNIKNKLKIDKWTDNIL